MSGFVKVCDADAEERLKDAVIQAAVVFCRKTQEDMDSMEGTCSLDIPVEFMELHYAVNDLFPPSAREESDAKAGPQ